LRVKDVASRIGVGVSSRRRYERNREQRRETAERHGARIRLAAELSGVKRQSSCRRRHHQIPIAKASSSQAGRAPRRPARKTRSPA